MPETTTDECERCNGEGHWYDEYDAIGVTRTECYRCGGTGEDPES
jgi:DnaJ-class molecular chaperone